MNSESSDINTGEANASPVNAPYAVFDVLDFPVCVIGPDGSIAYRNRSFARIFELDDAVRLDATHPFAPEYRRRIALAYTRVLKGQDRKCFAVVSSGGASIPIELHLYPMFHERVVTAILVFIKVVEERLLSFDRSTAESPDGDRDGDASLYDYAPFPIVRMDEATGIVKYGPTFETLIGCAFEEFTRKKLSLPHFLSAFDYERIRKAVADITAGSVAFRRLNEIRFTVGDEVKWTNAVLYAQRAAGPGAVEMILEDYSERKRLEDKLSFMNRLQIVGDLSVGLLHSFNNIINIILSRTQLLLQLAEKESVLEGLRIIEKNANESVKQIRIIQSFIDRGEQFLGEEEENIIDAIEDSIEFAKILYKVQERKRKRSIRIERRYFCVLTVKTNGQLLREVFVSMLFSLYPYIMRGDEVQLVLKDDDLPELSVSVAKSAAPAETLDAATEGLFLSELDIRRSADKLGIKIIEEESPAEYTIRAILPQQIIASRERARDDEGVDYKLRNLNVLVVEDEKELREVISEMFDHIGNRVAVFERAEDALAELREKEYAILVSDYDLPGMTGLELMAKAKEINESIVTALLTGWSLDNIGAYKNIVDIFLTKPFKLEVLIRSISRIMKSRKK